MSSPTSRSSSPYSPTNAPDLSLIIRQLEIDNATSTSPRSRSHSALASPITLSPEELIEAITVRQADNPRILSFKDVNVLIVEDVPMAAMALEGLLGACGFEEPQIKVVDNADAAVTAATREVFQIILMDNNLIGPKKGLQAAMEITYAKMAVNEPVPVMFFTSSEPCPDEHKHLFKEVLGKSPFLDVFQKALLTHWPEA